MQRDNATLLDIAHAAELILAFAGTMQKDAFLVDLRT